MINFRLLIAGLTIAVTSCSGDRATETRTYQLTGQILVVKPETNQVLVKHDDIPGFMPAMTMPYAVKDPAIIRDRAAGELIAATLEVAPDGAFLSAITKTGAAPLPEDARTSIPAAANIHILQAGDAAPETTLTDQDGQPVTIADFRGTAIAVAFIYTRCPLPQFCPLIDRRFAEVQKLVATDPALAGKARLLSISFDPQFDRAATLRAHAAKLGANPRVWRFATADEATVDRLAAQFGVNVIREKDGTITHNLRTTIIDATGHVSAIVDNHTWAAEELVRGLKNALTAAH